MQEAGDSGISVPVIFFDGEKETGIGDVLVSASLQFRDLQLGVGQRIGLSPNQFSVFFFFSSERKRQRKLQITANFNFTSITTGRSEESYFLVVLKRSRREKRFNGFEKVVLLRREVSPPSGFGRMEMERERYLWKRQPVLCYECERGTADSGSGGFHFHLCVNDPVTAPGFRSRAGPIARPVKNEMLFRF